MLNGGAKGMQHGKSGVVKPIRVFSACHRQILGQITEIILLWKKFCII
jgi:hypothetical protein